MAVNMDIQEKIQQLMVEADKYYHKHNYIEEIKYYDKIVALDPLFKEAYNNRGISYAQLGKYEIAITDYNKIIALDPLFKEAYLNRGVAYGNLGKNKYAEKDFDKAINLNPNFKQAYNNKGNLYNNLGKYKEAIIDLDKAIKLDSTYTDAYNNRGISYAHLKEYEKAIGNFNKAIDLYDKHTDAYFNRANLYNNLKEYEKAIIDYTKAIETDRNYSKAYFNRGVIYKKLGKDKECFDDYIHYIDFTDRAAYKLYFLLIKLYKAEKIDKEKIINTIKEIINKQIHDKIFDKNKTEIYSLYSYVPFNKNTIDAIVHDYKYAGEIFEFNDPTDPTIRLTENIKEMTEILKNIRIACYSTTPLNMLMYSHYTDKHKGICIEYDFSDFDKKDTILLKIDYEKKLKIDPENLQVTMKSNNDMGKEISFLDLFRTKHLNWEYENEYRVMTYGIDKIRRTIKAIYFGKDTSDADKELIVELTQNRSIKLYEVIVKPNNLFELDKREYIPQK